VLGQRIEKVVELPSKTGNEPIAAGDQEVTWILLVEDHASFRQALAFLLNAEPDLKVAAQAGSLAEARQAMKRSERIDLAVVDLALPDGDGVDLVRELSEMSIPALVLSASIENAWFARAVEAGAVGVIHKANAVNEVVEAVRRLRAGQALLSQDEVIEMLRAASKERQKGHVARLAVEQLTSRELEVLRALAEGFDSREIAEKLSITVETERTHMMNILGKLGARSRLQALVLAARYGLVEIR
jgi:two-component system nitrate/nitrite response regulator NarL